MTLNPLTLNVNEIIKGCNSDSPRQSFGNILRANGEQFVLLMAEFNSRCDNRFNQSLIYACTIINRIIERDNKFTEMFVRDSYKFQIQFSFYFIFDSWRDLRESFSEWIKTQNIMESNLWTDPVKAYIKRLAEKHPEVRELLCL